ncbi:Uncharacterised protein [Vibrio cholerae]|nr:Uncharacterised protein [Vibrio cholerae]CSI50452.1 Uncharacterised protein [Vibrio cholerae]CSI86600.1 Uncharacterised protein [Vibrio cholerae]
MDALRSVNSRHHCGYDPARQSQSPLNHAMHPPKHECLVRKRHHRY